jgi:hypothetical protein
MRIKGATGEARFREKTGKVVADKREDLSLKNRKKKQKPVSSGLSDNIVDAIATTSYVGGTDFKPAAKHRKMVHYEDRAYLRHPDTHEFLSNDASGLVTDKRFAYWGTKDQIDNLMKLKPAIQAYKIVPYKSLYARDTT